MVLNGRECILSGITFIHEDIILFAVRKKTYKIVYVCKQRVSPPSVIQCMYNTYCMYNHMFSWATLNDVAGQISLMVLEVDTCALSYPRRMSIHP